MGCCLQCSHYFCSLSCFRDTALVYIPLPLLVCLNWLYCFDQIQKGNTRRKDGFCLTVRDEQSITAEQTWQRAWWVAPSWGPSIINACICWGHFIFDINALLLVSNALSTTLEVSPIVSAGSGLFKVQSIFWEPRQTVHCHFLKVNKHMTYFSCMLGPSQ